MNNNIIGLAVALIIAIVGTHLIDSAYYNHKSETESKKTFDKNLQETQDFNLLLGTTYKILNKASLQPKLNCSMFQSKYVIDQCKYHNQYSQ